MNNNRLRQFTSFDEVDWSRWRPGMRATLCFVVRESEILLIEKKRGLGKGKINGPGGRIDPGESPVDCAVREVQEELCVTPLGLSLSGRLSFQFVDGLALRCHVFRAEACDGEPEETEEAVPMWTPLAEIPYHRMWADDRLWIPMMLEGRPFDGRFLFDGDDLLGYELDT